MSYQFWLEDKYSSRYDSGLRFWHLVVAVIVLALFFSSFTGMCGKFDSGDAEKNAQEYARKAGLVVLPVAGKDTDSDGYVSVTFRDRNDQPIGGQCATGYSSFFHSCAAQGCKLDTAKIMGTYRGHDR